MVFTSHLFLFTFLPLALALYYAAPCRWRNAMLAGLSYVFYAWSHPAFVVVMVASTLVDYGCGNGLMGAGLADRGLDVVGVDRNPAPNPDLRTVPNLVTGSPPALIGGIAHELGHIRRLDYVVNLLQVMVETLLFYHPIVHWISQSCLANKTWMSKKR